MGVDNFRIALDSTHAIFSPGSTVSGVVFLKVSGEESTSAIRITLSGIAETDALFKDSFYWSSSAKMLAESQRRDDNEGDEEEGSKFSSKKILIDSSRLLYGDGENLLQIRVGDHQFPFSFQLPDMGLPPSCRINPRCYVSYKLQASIAKPWHMSNVRTEVTSLRVVTPLNLNDIPWATMPLEIWNQNCFGLPYCSRSYWASQPLKLKAAVTAVGFCLGDRIPVKIQIENMSDWDVTNVTAELVRVWGLTAWDLWGVRYSAWEESEVLSTVHRNERVNKASLAQWEARLLVPSGELPSWFSASVLDIIKMNYELRVTAYVDSIFSWKLSVNLPLIIGTGGTRIEL